MPGWAVENASEVSVVKPLRRDWLLDPLNADDIGSPLRCAVRKCAHCPRDRRWYAPLAARDRTLALTVRVSQRPMTALSLRRAPHHATTNDGARSRSRGSCRSRRSGDAARRGRVPRGTECRPSSRRVAPRLVPRSALGSGSRACRSGRRVGLTICRGIWRSRPPSRHTPGESHRRGHKRTVAYPSFRFVLSAERPIKDYPKTLEHIGHHILKRRIEVGLTQNETAKRLGTNPWSLRNWETGRREIKVRFYPAVISFLGYNPLLGPRTLAERVTRTRISRGWSRKRLARESGVDEATIRRMEEGRGCSARRSLARVCHTLKLS